MSTMNNLTGQTGGCACGKVRYRLLADPIFVHSCHCKWCQRESGSACALNILMEDFNIENLPSSAESAYNFAQAESAQLQADQKVECQAAQTLVPSASKRGQTYWRCPECKVAVWSHYGGAGPAINFVRAGTLDNAALVTPDIYIFTASKMPWFVIPEGARRVDEFYDFGEVWPKGSIERFYTAKKTHESKHYK